MKIRLLILCLLPLSLSSCDDSAAPAGGRRERIVTRFDADEDGRLSLEERQAAKAARASHQQATSSMAGRQEGDLKERLLRRFDADGDGVLSEQERAKAKAAREAMLQQ